MKARPMKMYRVGIKDTIMLLSLSYLILSPHRRCVSDWGTNEFNPGDSQEVPPCKWYIMLCRFEGACSACHSLTEAVALIHSHWRCSVHQSIPTISQGHLIQVAEDTRTWSWMNLKNRMTMSHFLGYGAFQWTHAAWQYLRYCKTPTTILSGFSKEATWRKHKHIAGMIASLLSNSGKLNV